MWDAYKHWRRDRHRRKWRKWVVEFPDPVLDDWIEELQSRLRLLGMGSRGLRQARDSGHALGFQEGTAIYAAHLRSKIARAEDRWNVVMGETSDRYKELLRERHRRLHASGEVTEGFATWMSTQPSAYALANERSPGEPSI